MSAIPIQPHKASQIRAIAQANPQLTEFQIAFEMRQRGYKSVLASEVRSALRQAQRRRIKSLAPASP